MDPCRLWILLLMKPKPCLLLSRKMHRVGNDQSPLSGNRRACLSGFVLEKSQASRGLPGMGEGTGEALPSRPCPGSVLLQRGQSSRPRSLAVVHLGLSPWVLAPYPGISFQVRGPGVSARSGEPETAGHQSQGPSQGSTPENL